MTKHFKSTLVLLTVILLITGLQSMVAKVSSNSYNVEEHKDTLIIRKFVITHLFGDSIRSRTFNWGVTDSSHKYFVQNLNFFNTPSQDSCTFNIQYIQPYYNDRPHSFIGPKLDSLKSYLMLLQLDLSRIKVEGKNEYLDSRVMSSMSVEEYLFRHKLIIVRSCN